MKSLLQKGIPMMLALILLTLNACKDPCKDVACLNGGACVDGTCVCANGYTGTNCEVSPNPCENINCLNGGQCINGTCVCPVGYSGVLCENMAIATKLKITRIEVHNFPITDNGTAWDSFNAPDFYVVINEGDFEWNNYVFRSPTIDEVDVNTVTVLSYTGNLPITLDNIHTTEYTVSMLEEDVLSSSFVSGFAPVNFTQENDYLNNIVRLWNNQLDIRLHVEWQF